MKVDMFFCKICFQPQRCFKFFFCGEAETDTAVRVAGRQKAINPISEHERVTWQTVFKKGKPAF